MLSFQVQWLSFRAQRGICSSVLLTLAACARDSTPARDTTTAAPPPPAPVARGIAPAFASEQVKAGQKVYFTECVRCHTADRFVGSQFTNIWNTRRVYDLYDIVSSTMPQDIPGNLSQEQYLDVVAFMLQINGAKPGKQKLTSDPELLKKMRIGQTTSTEAQ